MDLEIRRQVANQVVDRVGEEEREGVMNMVLNLPHNRVMDLLRQG